MDVISLGGPTETTIWNILHPVGPDEDGSESIPYGRPNANNRAYVLDRDGLDCPDWVTGEICAAGTGLARGYWGDEARTAERFLHDGRHGERLYRTGDLGRYLPDGSIAILGRSDFQIKVNGYRIEAGEVETRLVGIDAVAKAVVAGRPGAQGDRLVAHLVPAGERRPGTAELREALRRDLPDYMVPTAVIWHEELPLTKNGKVDRGKLADVPVADTARAADAPSGGGEPATDTEKALVEIWSQVLRGAQVGVHDSLGALGGDSIAAARILTAVRKRFGVTIPLDMFADMDTVRAMAGALTPGRRISDRPLDDQSHRLQRPDRRTHRASPGSTVRTVSTCRSCTRWPAGWPGGCGPAVSDRATGSASWPPTAWNGCCSTSPHCS